MLVLHTAVLTTMLSRTTLQACSSSGSDEEDIKASETGPGHPYVGSHTTVSSDRLRGLMPFWIPWCCSPAWRSSKRSLLSISKVQLPKHLKILPITVWDIKL